MDSEENEFHLEEFKSLRSEALEVNRHEFFRYISAVRERHLLKAE